ncbi:MAG: CPBP family intramembrane glutamic endopeptidase, partial [Angelakisella sp.]
TIFFGIWLMRCGREFLFPLTVTRTDYLYPAVGAGLGVGMLGNIIAALLTLLLSSAGVQAKDNVPEFGGGISTTLLTILAVTVLPAILEELLFRGVLLQPLRKYGDGIAVVLSALMFAVCHPTLPQFVNAFIMGLCLGAFAVRSGSLTTTMLIHLVYNSIACVVTMLPLYLPQATASLVGWLIIFSLVAVGIYSCLVLRHRFGSVWRLPRNAYIPTGAGHATFSALCSLPFVLALLFNLMAIFRNLYI